MAIVTASEIAPISQEVLARSELWQRRNTVMQPLVRTYRLGKGADAFHQPKYSKTGINKLTDGQDMSDAQSFAPSVEIFTVDEFGGQVILTDRAMREANDDIKRDASEDLGMAMAVKIDTEIQTNFDLFTVVAIGDGSQEFEPKMALAARTRIMSTTDASGAEKRPAPSASEIYCVIHPYAAYDLQRKLIATGADNYEDSTQNMALKAARIGMILAIPIYEGAYLVLSSNAAKGSVFHKRAITHVVAKGTTMEPERDASLRAWELNLTRDFGHGIYENGWGAELHVDATLPTGLE